RAALAAARTDGAVARERAVLDGHDLVVLDGAAAQRRVADERGVADHRHRPRAADVDGAAGVAGAVVLEPAVQDGQLAGAVDGAPAPTMVRSSVMSRSPMAAAFSSEPPRLSTYVFASSSIVSAPGRALASMTAARSEVRPRLSAAIPLPGSASTESNVVLTV